MYAAWDISPNRRTTDDSENVMLPGSNVVGGTDDRRRSDGSDGVEDPPPPKNVGRLILQYVQFVDRLLFFLLTYSNRLNKFYVNI
jgi:hypothetical protein